MAPGGAAKNQRPPHFPQPAPALPPAPPGNNAARAPVPDPPAPAAATPSGDATAGTSAVVALRTSVDGAACRLPVVVRGSLATNCTVIAGLPNACLVAGDPLPRPCAPPSGDELPLAAALASGSAGDGAPGALCALASGAPGVLACQQGTACTEVAGEPRLAASPYGYCALNKTASSARLAVTITAPPPSIAAAVAAAAANATARTKRVAAVGGNGTKVAALTVAARATVGGAACRLPLYYGGVLLTDCVALGASGGPACFAKAAVGAQPCAPPPPGGPARTPLADVLAVSPPGDRGFGALCALPASPNTTAVDCLPGLLCAPMASGPLADSRYGYCAGGGVAPGGRPAALTAAGAAPGDGAASRMLVARARRTTTGATCRLPLYVNGSLLADCAAIDGATACYTGSALLKTAPCAATQTDWASVPLADLVEAGRAGDGGRGALCALPGAKWKVGAPCDKEYRCAPARAGPLNGSASVGVCSASAATAALAAAAGAPPGLDRVAPAYTEKDAKAALANGTLLVARRRTVTGDLCRLPLVLASGRLAVDCRPLGGFTTPACYTEGLVTAAPCAPAPADAAPRSIASILAAGGGGDGGPGALCSVFGGTYAGAMPATPCGAGLKCAPYAGVDYGYCAPASVPAPAVSAGDPVPAPTPTPASLAAVDVARRSSVTGLPCRLPVRVAGALVTDCAALQGGADRCFVDGNLTVAHPCAPASPNKPPLPLVVLEGDGRLSDGRRGAVCHLVPPPPLAGGGGSVASPPTPIVCKFGLECVPFAGPPLAGTRLGWCKRKGVAAVGDTNKTATGTRFVGPLAPGPNATLAAVTAGGVSGERGPPPDRVAAGRNATARTPFWGAPVYDHAPNLGASQYYCGPSCVFGSLLAMAATVVALTFVCVLACRRPRAGGDAAAAAGPPAGAYTGSAPPAAPAPAPAPAGGGGGIALSLRPSRYERFEDVGAPPAAQAPPPAAPTNNPFAAGGGASQASQQQPPVQLSFKPLPK